MDIDVAFQTFTLIFKNEDFEEEFQRREKKAINSFAFYSAYTLMLVDLAIAIFSTVMDYTGGSMVFYNKYPMILLFSIVFTLIFESLTYFVKFLLRARGICLIVCLYSNLYLIYYDQSAPEVIVVMYSFLLTLRGVCIVLFIEVIGIAYVVSWLAMATSSIISCILLIVFLLVPNITQICILIICSLLIALIVIYSVLLAYGFFLSSWNFYYQEKTLRTQFLIHKNQQKVLLYSSKMIRKKHNTLKYLISSLKVFLFLMVKQKIWK